MTETCFISLRKHMYDGLHITKKVFDNVEKEKILNSISVESDGKIQKVNEKRSKGLFYATKEFDLTESENEDEILSVKPAYHKQTYTRTTKPNENLSTSSSITRPPPIIRHTLLDNRLEQTGV